MTRHFGPITLITQSLTPYPCRSNRMGQSQRPAEPSQAPLEPSHPNQPRGRRGTPARVWTGTRYIHLKLVPTRHSTRSPRPRVASKAPVVEPPLWARVTAMETRLTTVRMRVILFVAREFALTHDNITFNHTAPMDMTFTVTA